MKATWVGWGRERLRALFGTFWMLMPVLLLLACAAATVLRLTVRDRLPVLAILFYATPPLLLSGPALLAAGLFRLQRRPRWALVALGVSLGLAGWGLSLNVFHHPTPPDEAAVSPCRVVFWNVCRGWMGWEQVAEELVARRADLAGLVEARPAGANMKAFWQGVFPDYQVAGRYGSVLIVRGRVLSSSFGHLSNTGRYSQHRVEIDGRQMNVLLVDIKSNPILSRRSAFEALQALARKLSDRPLVIMGDFNTPMDSVHVELLRGELANTFEAAGNGYAATWPIPLPLLSLDQIWVNDHLRVRSCWAGWTRRSDHRPVICELE